MIRFIHTADNHLGNLFKGFSNKQKSEEAREAVNQAFRTVAQLAIQKQVDFVLISGDLYNSEQQHIQELLLVQEEFERLRKAEISVFMIQGNHDFEQQTNLLPFPNNVVVFDKTIDTKTYTSKQGEVVALSGFSYATRWVRESMIQQFPFRDEAVDYHIGLYHGSIDSADSEHAHYAPFSLMEMKQKNYDYWALGHIHKREILSHIPMIAYSGNTQGLKRTETGEKGCYLVEIEKQQPPVLTFLPTSQFIWKEMSISLAGIFTATECYEVIRTALNTYKEEKTVYVSIYITDYEIELASILSQQAIPSSFVPEQIVVYKVIVQPLTKKHFWNEELTTAYQQQIKEVETTVESVLTPLFQQKQVMCYFSEWQHDPNFKQEVFDKAQLLIQEQFATREGFKDED